jgi:hypothetical protein
MTTAAQLIKRSYYLSQVLDPREEIEGFQASEGLFELNRIIDTWGSLTQYIPSYSILTINVLPNVSSYDQTPVITQLSEGHLLDQNNVQFDLVQIDLQRFNTLNFTLSAQSPTRPNLVFPQNDFANWPTLTKIRFFPVPDTTYTATLYAMLRLANVTYSQDLTTVPAYWISAMEYELAKKLITIYGTTPAVTFGDDYTTIMRQLKAANRRDRRVQVSNQFRNIRRYKPWSVYVD